MGQDDVYRVETSKVGSFLHCVRHSEVNYRPWTSPLDINHPDPLHVPVAANYSLCIPDDGRGERPKH